MDLLTILTSLNKISLIAFFITFVFLSYQIYLLKKESFSRQDKPFVPDFKENQTTASSHFTKIIAGNEVKTALKKQNRHGLIIIGVFLSIIFAIIFIGGLFNLSFGNIRPSKSEVPKPVVNLVASKGIKVYNQDWIEVKKPSGQIFIGIATIPGVDIDMARIRVNENTWGSQSASLKFKSGEGVFYREYTIATGESSLKIEAQLHSKTDGWLGD